MDLYVTKMPQKRSNPISGKEKVKEAGYDSDVSAGIVLITPQLNQPFAHFHIDTSRLFTVVNIVESSERSVFQAFLVFFICRLDLIGHVLCSKGS